MYYNDSSMKKSTPIKETACHECSILVDLEPIRFGYEHHCPRCNALLYRPGNQFKYIIIMAISALIAFVPTIFLPILTLDIAGELRSITLFDAVISFFRGGEHIFLGLIALFTSLVIPLSILILLLLILVPLHLGYSAKEVRLFYRVYDTIREWGMAEVYMLSIVVSTIKLTKMGDLQIGYGFFAFLLFLACFYITLVWFNPDDIWHNEHQL